MIQAVLFDKDGTLIDFTATFGPATDAVLSDLANGNDELADMMAGSVGYVAGSGTFSEGSVLIAGSLNNIAEALLPYVPDTGLDKLVHRIGNLYDTHSLASLTPFDWLVPTLDQIADRNLPMGIATNDAETTARAHMERLNILSRFHTIIGYDSGYGEKPGSGMIQAFTQQLELAPHEVMMVGDSTHDLMAANAAGALAVAVTSGLAGKDVLEVHADHVLENISQLPDLIDKLNKTTELQHQ